jgi:PAS domain S-box-containing protein
VTFAPAKLDAERAREQAQREAEAGLDRFSRLFRSAPMPTLITELADGTVVDINEAGCRAYGVHREAVIGRTLPSIGIGLSATARQTLIERLSQDGRASHIELNVKRADGEIRTILASAERIDWEGRQRLLSMGIDITELRAAQRTREQMIAAERSNQAKTEFISRMSHELRTPLNAVLGFAQLLGASVEPLTTQQRAHLHRLHDGALHLQALIDDVIDIASIEAGRLKMVPVPLEVEAVVASAIALCAAAAERARVEMVVDLAPGSALRVRADPTRLRQVLTNLLSNGIKYNRPGRRVVVSAGLAGDRVRLEVADDGLGMTAVQLQRLFTPYDRLGRESSGVVGTGIGLVLSRELVEMMGGRLTVHSEAGLGTRVEVELPSVADSRAETSRIDTAHAARSDGTGVVLYVEDEPVNRLLVEEALRTCDGVELLLAECGRDAVAEAVARRPDLVLLDMHLPDMDGPQVMSMLRSHAATEHIPVVALSASAMSEDVDRARAGGAVEYWSKPIDIKRLRSDVRRLLATAQRPL